MVKSGRALLTSSNMARAVPLVFARPQEWRFAAMGPREADPAARLAADYDVRQLFRSRSRAHWGRDTLQTFKDAASQTLVPMTAMTTAVEALGKGISEGNSGLAQGLENIGLSFHAIATITYARRFACDAQRVEMERSRRRLRPP